MFKGILSRRRKTSRNTGKVTQREFEEILTKRLRDKGFDITQRECKHFVYETKEVLKDLMEDGYSVSLHGFGRFEVYLRKKRGGINPQTFEYTSIPARRVGKFRAGYDLKNRLNKKMK